MRSVISTDADIMMHRSARVNSFCENSQFPQPVHETHWRLTLRNARIHNYRMTLTFQLRIFLPMLLCTVLAGCIRPAPVHESTTKQWTVGTPIVTYWAGPPMTDAAAQQMADGGWNVVWCGEKELDVA